MSTKMDDIGEKHDWRLVAVALAGVVRPLSREDELRRGWDAAAEKARRAEADAEAELRRAERAEADARNAWAEVDTLTVRLEAAEAARAQAVPVADPTDPTGDIARMRARSIDILHADLNALREKQLDTQARCDKAIQARVEAQRERAAAEKSRDEATAELKAVQAERDDASEDLIAARVELKKLKQANAALADKLGPAADIDPVPGAGAGASAEPETSQSAADRAGRLELVTIGQIIQDGRGGSARVCGVLHNANRPGHALSFGLGAAEGGKDPGPMRPVGVWAAEGWDVLP